MTLINLIVILVVIGVIMWLVNTQIPMSAGIKKVLNIAVVVIVVLWLLKVAGLMDGLGAITVG